MVSKLELARFRAHERCRSFSVLLTQSVGTGVRMAAWRVPCKSWNCPRCAKKKTKEIAHKAKLNFDSNHLRFLTLTIKPMKSLPSALIRVNHSWNRLRLSITRKFGKVKYFKVIEAQHSTNMPHFHILIDKFIPSAWLNQAVTRAGFGRIYKIKRVTNDKVFNYVTKYLGKGITNDNFLEALITTNGRRYSFSRRIIHSSTPSLYTISLFIKTGNLDAIHSLISHFYRSSTISTGTYPLSSSPNFAEFFIPASVPLLPAPPPSGSAVS